MGNFQYIAPFVDILKSYI